MTYHPTPPPAPRAVMPDDVPTIDRLKAIGMKQYAIADHLGVHRNTIRNVLARRGAYEGMPK